MPEGVFHAVMEPRPFRKVDHRDAAVVHYVRAFGKFDTHVVYVDSYMSKFTRNSCVQQGVCLPNTGMQGRELESLKTVLYALWL